MKKYWIPVGLALLAVVGFGILSVSRFAHSGSQRIALRLQAIRAAGDPVSMSDYWNGPLRPEENGLAQLEFASRDLLQFGKEHSELVESGYLGPGYRLSEEQVAEIDRMFANVPDLLPRLRTVASCKRSVDDQLRAGNPFDVDRSDIFGNSKLAVMALTVDALASASRGDGDDALAKCSVALDLQVALRSFPTMLDVLQEFSSERVVFETANHVLRITEPSEQAISDFKSALMRIDHQARMGEAIKTERVHGVFLMQQLRSAEGLEDSEGTVHGIGGSLLSGTPFNEIYLNDDAEMYLDMMQTNLDAVGQSREIRTQMLRQSVTTLSDSSFIRYSLSKLCQPLNVECFDEMDRADARLAAMLLVCDWAAQLNDPASAPSAIKQIDPFGGKPMQVSKSSTGLTFYSVGENCIDDGGNIKDESALPGLDIGFGPLLKLPSQDAAIAPGI